MRRPANRRGPQTASVAAPTRGIYESRPSAIADPLGAEVVQNFLPNERGLEVRGGVSRFAFVTDPVKSFMTYVRVSGSALFAATDDAIYDITSVAVDTAPTADVTSLTSGDWSFQQIGTTGGTFIMCVNGADAARLYNGSAWSTASITGVTSSDLSHVWLYQNRLFLIEKGTLTAWYLPAGSIGGAAGDISLAGVFRRGGRLLFGATWALDSGDGLDDKCVFVSTEGEVAVYAGSDPSDATTWRLEGRYDIGKPLGKRAIMQAGGDLLIATDDGIVPMSSVVTKDPAALSLAAVTAPIRDTWSHEAEGASFAELHKWTDETLLLTVFPGATKMLTANLQTGAWAEQTGWSGTCATTYEGAAYVGRPNGRIYKLNTTGTDDGDTFTARACFSFRDFGDPTAYKITPMARASFLTGGESFVYDLSVATDYDVSFPTPPTGTGADSSVMVWDVSKWDEAVWGVDRDERRQGLVDQWRAIVGEGFTMAPIVQVSSGGGSKLNVTLIGVDLLIEGGRAVA